MVDRFNGAILIFAIGAMALNQAFEAIIQHPNLVGIGLAISMVIVGVGACISIARDRLS